MASGRPGFAVGLAIVEYQRLLSLEEMSPLQKALFDALGKAQAMEVAELQGTGGDARARMPS